MRLACLLFLLLMPLAACAGQPVKLDDQSLADRAAQPWDKAALMHTTVELGSYRGVPVVADHPCSDVCPQYTVRIIHYRLPEGTSCASVGGVEKAVLVPVAITTMKRTYCVPEPLVAPGTYYSR